MWNDSIIEAVRRTSLPRLSTPDGDTLTVDSMPQKRGAIDDLIRRCKRLGLSARNAYVTQLTVTAGVDVPRDLMMTSDEVRRMSCVGMDIGAHTAAHPVLTAVSTEESAREISMGARRIAEITGTAPRLFAYPNGKPGGDYSAEHVGMVRASSFEFAFSTAPGYASARSDRLQLPRFTPWDRDPFRYAARLWAHYFVQQRDQVT